LNRRRCSLGGIRHALALGGKNADRRVHLHTFGTLFDHDLRDRAFVDGLDLHGCLVGLDFADDLTRLHHVADLDVPLGQLALGHGRRERGH
jgi:hypothetical protein